MSATDLSPSLEPGVPRIYGRGLWICKCRHLNTWRTHAQTHARTQWGVCSVPDLLRARLNTTTSAMFKSDSRLLGQGLALYDVKALVGEEDCAYFVLCLPRCLWFARVIGSPVQPGHQTCRTCLKTTSNLSFLELRPALDAECIELSH